MVIKIREYDLLFVQKPMRDWFVEKGTEYLKGLERPHGAKIGDKVKLHCADWHYSEPLNDDAVISVRQGAIGTITELLGFWDVKVEFDCVVEWDDGYEQDDECEITLHLVECNFDFWEMCGELLPKLKPKYTNPQLFEQSE